MTEPGSANISAHFHELEFLFLRPAFPNLTFRIKINIKKHIFKNRTLRPELAVAHPSEHLLAAASCGARWKSTKATIIKINPRCTPTGD
jgi:hypothetical protein